jgi:hypothetical protein
MTNTDTSTTPPLPPKKKSGVPIGKTQLNVYITPECRGILDALLARDGVPYSAQVERALWLWAKEKGIEVPHADTSKDGTAR